MGVAAVVVVLAYGLLNLSRHPRQQANSKTMEAVEKVVVGPVDSPEQNQNTW
jgi:hypothetical protein